MTDFDLIATFLKQTEIEFSRGLVVVRRCPHCRARFEVHYAPEWAQAAAEKNLEKEHASTCPWLQAFEALQRLKA